MKNISIYQFLLNGVPGSNHKSDYTFWIDEDQELFKTINLPPMYNLYTVKANQHPEKFELILERE